MRRAREDDLRFVFDSWAKSYYEGVPKSSVRNGYWKAQRELIGDIFEAGAVVLVACSREDEDALYGWACGEPQQRWLMLHYCYTKRPFRHRGVARSLVRRLEELSPGRRVVCSHSPTKRTRKYIHDRRWSYDPTAPLYRYITRRLPSE